jgi:crotonobetainyl-CoA:carnitine CoA-transferase CaiB-like acyl-CoA transferase
MNNPDTPLAGIRVVDLSVTLPGPYCTQMLRRLGASVVHVEPPGGDSLRWVAPISFAWLAEGKESVAVDLKDPVDRDLAMSLLADADVVVQGWRPGVADRLGVSYADVAALNPGVVYCSLSGYGHEGELAHRPGHDINYLSESGAFDLLKSDGLPVGDLAGASAAVSRILAGLYRVQRTGLGSELDISIAGALGEWVEAIGGERCEDFLTVYEAPHYGAFETKDGERLVLGVAQEQRLWSNLITTLGRPEWATLDHNERSDQRDRITDYLAQRIGVLSSSELSDLFSGVDTCWSFVRSPLEASRFPRPFPEVTALVPEFDEHRSKYRKAAS